MDEMSEIHLINEFILFTSLNSTSSAPPNEVYDLRNVNYSCWLFK